MSSTVHQPYCSTCMNVSVVWQKKRTFKRVNSCGTVSGKAIHHGKVVPHWIRKIGFNWEKNNIKNNYENALLISDRLVADRFKMREHSLSNSRQTAQM